MEKVRQLPNILITGTPGVGKSSLSKRLVSDSRVASLNRGVFRHLDLGVLIKEHKLFTEWDDDLNVSIFSEDLIEQYLTPLMNDPKGGFIVDFHSATFLPSEWFDLVIVLRTDTKTLYDRLQERGYSIKKINENIESEIFQIIYDEVLEAYQDTIEIWTENNNTSTDLISIVNKFFETLHNSALL
jgi:adenylate kinase